jgi:hypothetical protein
LGPLHNYPNHVQTSLSINSTPQVVPSTTSTGSPIICAEKSHMGFVYTVLELAGVLKIKSVPIARESAKAIFLDDSMLTPSSNQPKRLLIKGYDMIARTEKEAVEQYIHFLKEKLVELDQAKLKTQELIGTAKTFLGQFS